MLYRHIELENIIMSEDNVIVLANNIENDEEIYDITEIIKEETHKNIIRMEMAADCVQRTDCTHSDLLFIYR